MDEFGQIEYIPEMSDKTDEGKNSLIRLTLISEEDEEILRRYGVSELRRRRIVRLCREAEGQGVTLTHKDLATLLMTSLSTIRRDLRAIAYSGAGIGLYRKRRCPGRERSPDEPIAPKNGKKLRPGKLLVLLALFFALFAPVRLFCPSGIGPFLGVSDAGASIREDERRLMLLYYKRYYIYGDIELKYRKYKIKTDTETETRESDQSGFSQRYRLNLLSYIYHPKLLMYTIGVNWNIGSGELGGGNSRRYYINMDFLKTKRLNFEIHADYRDGKGSDSLSEGFSISYTRLRKTPTFKNMREYSLWLNQQRMNQRNQNQNQNQNLNRNNLNQEISNQGNEGQNTNMNVNQNVMNRNRLPKPKGSLLDRVLPVTFFFSFDHYHSSLEDGGNSSGYNASFNMGGDFKTDTSRTSYNVNMSYLDAEDNTYDEQRFRILGKSITAYNDRRRMEWETSYDARNRDGRTNYFNLKGSYNGFFKKVWSYNLHLNYEWGGHNSIYGFGGSIGRSSRLWKFHTSYRLGAQIQYNEGIGKSNVSGFGSISASRRLSKRQVLNLRARLSVGTSATSFRFGVDTRYRLTRTFNLIASYNFTTTQGKYSSYFEGERTYTTSHQARIGVNGRVGRVYLGSFASYSRNDSYDSAQLRLYMRTILFYKVRFGLGANLNWTNNSREYEYSTEGEEASGGSQTSVSVYNNISFSPWYRSVFRVYSSYLKVFDGSNLTRYKVSPSLSWRIRKVFLTCRYSYDVNKTGEKKNKSQKITVTLTRPFWF